MLLTKDIKNRKLINPESVAKLLKEVLSTEHETDQKKEHFWVIGLNNSMQIEYLELASLGILNASLVHPREIFRLAIMKAVKSIIIAHNHPSGINEPSNEDIDITKRLVQSGEVLAIPVLDHIIVPDNYYNYYSFKENDLI